MVGRAAKDSEAGDLAHIRAVRQAGDPQSALRITSTAIAALKGRHTRHLAVLLLESGRLREVIGDERGGADDFARAAATAEASGDRSTAIAALAGRARVARSGGWYADAQGHLDHAARLTQAGTVEAAVRAEVLAEVGWLAVETGDDPIAPFGEAMALTETTPRDPQAARVRIAALIGRGTALRSSGDFAGGRADLRRALELAESTFGSAAYEVAETLDAIGVLGKFAGDFEASEAAYQRAAGILRVVFGEDHPDMAAIYHNLAGLAHARGDSRTGEPLARRSVEIRERTLGPDHLATVLDRAGHAAILDALGRNDEAADMLSRVLTDLERIVGPGHREVAVTLNNLAAIDQRRGDLVTAEGRYRRALAIKARIQGPTAPALANTYNNLGTVLRQQGRYEEASEAYSLAIGLLAEAVGDDHPTLVAARRNLGRLRSGFDE